MNATPPVTVITSTFNWPDALRAAIQTVLEQSFTDFEYLIIGDGCTDNTAQVVREFRDPRIRWTNLPKNLGNQSDVNRVALKQARGSTIAYLNHDDLWFPDHLETLYRHFCKHDLDIINSLCLSITPPGQFFRGILGLPWRDESAGGYTNYVMTTSVMHRATTAAAVGSWTNWRDTAAVPTQEFFGRLRNYRQRYATIPYVTALKFHSGNRRNCYRRKTAFEQVYWLKQIREDPNLRHREMAVAMCCQTFGEKPPALTHPPAPNNPPPGWQIEQWRRLRGLAPMLDLGDTEPEDTDIGLNPTIEKTIRHQFGQLPLFMSNECSE